DMDHSATTRAAAPSPSLTDTPLDHGLSGAQLTYGLTSEAVQVGAVEPAPIAPDSAVSMLHKMGVPSLECHNLPILNSYFSCLMRHAKDVAERRWPQVAEAAGLQRYLTDDPADDGERTATI